MVYPHLELVWRSEVRWRRGRGRPYRDEVWQRHRDLQRRWRRRRHWRRRRGHEDALQGSLVRRHNAERAHTTAASQPGALQEVLRRAHWLFAGVGP